ncbi:DUF5916 domain-containing protein [Aequorivita antarctica]|uniref:Carbohydrate binding family 9 domain-containing protein n=1 Tax=Aequorivita antarctica TaxID=153266 RepID=A0A5C6Z4M7_9FLAO|nr:DUF5916 domain-containing protein [Aequorivita antarctica]TXD75057.1 carbohydrate binding family 9 domain-containing protein [Aequorivita antarctica]SRX72213.1 hypothetical protein AEQU3_00044 [Aequorivita antarctica]
MNICFKAILLSLFFPVCFSVNAQTADSILRKKITIPRIIEAPKIDGILNDEAWQNAPIATNFVERQPNNGKPIADSLKTEVKIVYDDLGIYFGATMKDPQPDQILKELTERDGIGNDDFFFVLLNGYNDRQQSLQFIVTAAGVQYDAKMTNENEDNSWNGIWYSAVQINDDGWVAEIFIPYSEVRFPNKNVQLWGLNMEREMRRTRTRYSWSHVDNTKGSFSIYDGEIYGIENIKSPTRLSFQPYVSAYVNDYDGKTETIFNGGMDLKYGINDAFTLDMILIPDFGQSKFDAQVLNLSAFEVQYEENRPFFTEGTELFTKGNLFYSRRVGGYPSGHVTLTENEETENFPPSVDLINAFKISGRTDGNLGIGIFNAITERTYANIKNTETEETRKELVEPLANYNILVLDQRFGDNSSVSFVNTNVIREDGFRDADATGLYMDLTNKKNTLNYFANAEGSWVKDGSAKFGMEGNAGMAKINGSHRISGEINFRTMEYDINDLGYSSNTNFINYSGYYGYRYLQPKGFLNNLNLNFNLIYTRRLETDLYNNFVFNFNSSFTTKKFLGFGGGFEMTPFGTNDIYEPRIEGRYVKVPDYYDVWGWFSTDYRKKLATDVKVDWYKYNEEGRGELHLEFSPRYRVSDKLKMFLGTNVILSDKEEGFVDSVNDDIIFGKRDRNTVINSLESQYIFNNKMALNLAFRHYYSEVEYSQFYTLQSDGGLLENAIYDENRDATYNNWNIDLRFSWWFAPGSQLTLLYRNAMDSYVGDSRVNFSNNFRNLFDESQLNSLSFRVSYYLDYNRVKNWVGPKNKTQPVGAAFRDDKMNKSAFSNRSDLKI